MELNLKRTQSFTLLSIRLKLYLTHRFRGLWYPKGAVSFSSGSSPPGFWSNAMREGWCMNIQPCWSVHRWSPNSWGAQKPSVPSQSPLLHCMMAQGQRHAVSSLSPHFKVLPTPNSAYSLPAFGPCWHLKFKWQTAAVQWMLSQNGVKLSSRVCLCVWSPGPVRVSSRHFSFPSSKKWRALHVDSFTMGEGLNGRKALQEADHIVESTAQHARMKQHPQV